MISAKMAALGPLKIKVLWNIDYIGYSFCPWRYQQKFITWLNYHNFNFIRIWPKKKNFFERWSWFKFDNLGIALGMTLKFYTSVAQWFRKFWGLNHKFAEVTRKKLIGRGGVDFPSPSWIGLRLSPFFILHMLSFDIIQRSHPEAFC